MAAKRATAPEAELEQVASAPEPTLEQATSARESDLEQVVSALETPVKFSSVYINRLRVDFERGVATVSHDIAEKLRAAGIIK